jgi:uncharacterized protein
MGVKFVGKCALIEDVGKRILVVGDLHLGFEESLNRSGVFVSGRMYEDMIEHFDLVFDGVGKVDLIVLLGDVKHAFGSILKQEWKDVLNLLEYFKGKLAEKGELVVVKGNHDAILEPIVKKGGVEVVDYLVIGKYCFVHGDKAFDEMEGRGVKVWVMGHGHPAIKLSDGIKIEKYKCFLIGKYKRREVIILPSFPAFNEGSDPREFDLGLAWEFDLGGFNVKLIGEGVDVLDFGKLGEM